MAEKSVNSNAVLAEKDYMSGMKYKDIAEKYETTLNTVKSWKKRYGWDRKGCTQKGKGVHTKQAAASVLMDDGTEETLQNKELTAKQQMFCIFYVRDFNAVQAYQSAYKCTYINACSHAWLMLKNEEVSREIERLKEIKRKNIHFTVDDIVDLQMRIAFANLEHYVSFGRKEVPQWKQKKDDFTPVIDPNTGQQKINTYNVVNLMESANVDMQLVQEVKEGKDGVSIKLADRQKAVSWLTKYFEFMPGDRRKVEFDRRKLELSLAKLEMEQARNQAPEPEENNDNFLDALNRAAANVWKEE